MVLPGALPHICGLLPEQFLYKSLLRELVRMSNLAQDRVHGADLDRLVVGNRDRMTDLSGGCGKSDVAAGLTAYAIAEAFEEST